MSKAFRDRRSLMILYAKTHKAENANMFISSKENSEGLRNT